MDKKHKTFRLSTPSRFKVHVPVTMQTEREIEINRKVRKLAKQWRCKSLKMIKEEILKQMFDIEWISIIDRIATKDVSIKCQIECMLREKDSIFEQTIYHVYDEQYYEKLTKLEDTISIDKISDDFIQIHELFKVWDRDHFENCKRQTFDITNIILRKVYTKLTELNANYEEFNVSYLDEILHFVNTYIDNHNKRKEKDYKFYLLSPFRAMVLAHVSCYAVVHFIRINDTYNKKMQEYKETAWKILKTILESKTADVDFLVFFRGTILHKVVKHVSDCLSIDALDSMLWAFSNNKYNLIKYVLIHLAETEKFENIKSFIEDPRACTEEWLMVQTKYTLFEEESNGINFITGLAKIRIDKIFAELKMSINQANEKTKTDPISTWIDHFVNNITESTGLPFLNTSFVPVENPVLPDLQNFVEMLTDQLVEMENDAVTCLKKMSANEFEWKTDIVQRIMDTLWGCEQVCMFCGEPCIYTESSHVTRGCPHKCLHHRPQGINGMKSKNADKLEEITCNRSLITEHSYEKVRDKSGKFIEYKINFPE